MEGQKKASVAESVSSSRARFTAMTTVQDWLTDNSPGIGVMFRMGAAACSLDSLLGALTNCYHSCCYYYAGYLKGSALCRRPLGLAQWLGGSVAWWLSGLAARWIGRLVPWWLGGLVAQ